MRTRTLAAGFLAISLAFGQQVSAPEDERGGPPDEPGLAVARLSVLSGEASVRRGDSGDWVAAALNAPLMAGDSISVAPAGATEVQLDGANFARLAGDSEMRIAEFDAGRYQMQLARGLVTYRVLRQTNARTEISTQQAAVRPLGLASVRVEVTPDGSTRVIVRHGEVEVSTRRGAERLSAGNMMMIRGGPDDAEFQTMYAPAADQWDGWSDQRDVYLQRAQSPRYVSHDIYGTEDLDNYGSWNNDPSYGDVWTPSVPASWAPYHDGRWVWEDYYGWTWLDASPWGWAPFHYGSWYFRTGFGWSWFPGRRYDRAWYRPALVGFFGFGGGGGLGFGVGFGNIGWVPLGPYERYHPWYGRGGWGGRNTVFNNINIVHNTNITNVYRNARFANGVTAVSGADFQRGNFRNRMSVGGAQLQQGSLVRGAVPVTPGGEHLRFSDRAQRASGPRVDSGNQRYFSRMPANAATTQRVPFAQQQSAVRTAFQTRGVPSDGAGSFGSFAQTGGSAGAGRQFGGAGAGGRNGASATPGWQRFGSPQVAPREGFTGQPGTPFRGQSQGQADRFVTPSAGGIDNRFGRQSRSLEVAPPIVRERQSTAGTSPRQDFSGRSFSRPEAARQAPFQDSSSGGSGGRSFSQPQYRNPAQPQMRAPSEDSYPRYQGRGGFGQPSVRSGSSGPAYRSAPPAPRGGGGNVGGGNRGGGGGHGNRR